MPRAVLLLGGTTCSGKTALGIALAKRFDAEIVSADSRQIYRGMPIGTAAPTEAQCASVRHHLVGFLDPHVRYNAAQFASDALERIAAIHALGRHAIVVGGTGFYLRALAGDVALAPARDESIRLRLARETIVHPPEVLHAWLRARDPVRAAALAPGDRYRNARALEIALARTLDAPSPTPQVSLRAAGVPFVKVYLDVAPEIVDERIALRVETMLAAGLLDEAERIGPDAVAADAVGYPQALAFLAGHSTAPELRASLARATRRYAKRQRTWFRSEVGLHRLAPESVAAFARSELGWKDDYGLP
jgi:tRNA dimethylallyltransferase